MEGLIMIGQNNNNTNNQSLNNLNNTNTPDKTKPQTNIYLSNTSTLNTSTSTPTTPPQILNLQKTYNLRQLETFEKMKEYKKWSEMIDYVQDNFDRVKLELAECDAKELKAFIDLYQEKMRLNEGEG